MARRRPAPMHRRRRPAAKRRRMQRRPPAPRRRRPTRNTMPPSRCCAAPIIPTPSRRCAPSSSSIRKTRLPAMPNIGSARPIMCARTGRTPPSRSPRAIKNIPRAARRRTTCSSSRCRSATWARRPTPAPLSRGWITISRRCPLMCAARRPPRSDTWAADAMEGAVAGSMTPLAAAEFERLMVRFAPFEAGPHLAVACSGGGDSMALAILADRWAYARGGNVTALIVAHRLLVCADAPPAGNLEDAARRARYGLLEAWCEDNGVLHLLTAHQRDDQAETLLMRLARGSGLDGLAGIAPVSIRRTCRVLRPLLTIPPERLRATLRDHGVAHVEDPMNRDPAFQRVRLRAARAFLAEEGLSAERLAATAARLARARGAVETMVTTTLACAVAL